MKTCPPKPLIFDLKLGNMLFTPPVQSHVRVIKASFWPRRRENKQEFSKDNHMFQEHPPTREVPAPPKPVKMAKYPSKMAGWRVSS